MSSATFNQDKELAEFFTDVEYLRDAFKNAVAAPTLTKRLLVIHGVGGVGKSSLLRMFRLHCKSVKVPVALASGDEAKSALDVLGRWTDDLKADSVAFPSFGKTFEHYRAIQAKVDERAKKAQDARGRAADIAGKATSKTAEAVGGALAGAAIGSVIPGIGTTIGGALGGVLGGMGAEALVDWLRGFLPKPDIDLLLDPAKKLTDDFLTDVAQAADKRHIVLMLDTFEQMTALDDWARDAAQRVGQVANLSHGVLFVIAGRALPDWSRAWQSWMANAQVEELKPMTEDNMRELVQRYYATMRGGEPNPAQVEAIIRFARGLPMVVTSAVQLWVKYGVEDFQSVKAEIVANLVDRLMEGVPSALIPALEAAAIVHWFDQPILRAVTGLVDVRDVYNELRRFPFVRVRVEGLALHDAVREIVDENVRAQDSERHRELHERAAAYFEKRLGQAETSEVSKDFGSLAERLGLERLYHRVRADEEAGIKLFQEMAEELVRYRLVNRLRALLNDANNYSLIHENSKLWTEYYKARLAHLEMRLDDAECMYQSVSGSDRVEPRLRAYALGDWGTILEKSSYLAVRGEKQALQVVTDGLATMPLTDGKRAALLLTISGIHMRLGQEDLAFHYAYESLEWLYENSSHDYYAILGALNRLKDIAFRFGDWKRALEFQKKGIEILDGIESNHPKAGFLGTWAVAWSWMGRYSESENNARYCLENLEKEGLPEATLGPLRDLGFALGAQERFDEATTAFRESIEVAQRVDQARRLSAPISEWFNLWYRGAMLAKQGRYLLAAGDLRHSLAISKRVVDNAYSSAPHFVLGTMHETRRKWKHAERHYNYAYDSRLKQKYFKSMGFTGLVRVKHAQGDYAAIPSLLAEAEQLAQQYEYNDHLVSLRLTQGMTTDKIETNGQTALDYFKQAMIYALRYNRFLLDEVLSGRPQGTPLRPIIPYCLARGEEGRRMLIALRDWWKTGVNDIGTPRPDTISPIPEGIPLLEAEHLAREREPGDGAPQKSVVEQIESALAGA